MPHKKLKDTNLQSKDSKVNATRYSWGFLFSIWTGCYFPSVTWNTDSQSCRPCFSQCVGEINKLRLHIKSVTRLGIQELLRCLTNSQLFQINEFEVVLTESESLDCDPFICLKRIPSVWFAYIASQPWLHTWLLKTSPVAGRTSLIRIFCNTDFVITRSK